jgi:hypothetical protein
MNTKSLLENVQGNDHFAAIREDNIKMDPKEVKYVHEICIKLHQDVAQ